MRRFLADTLAMITFSTIVGMVVEILISGMTVSQSMQARLTAIIPNLLTGRLYGVFRDWVSRKIGVREGEWIRKGIADILAFALFQVPLYASILALSGASKHQILTACGTVTIFSALMGWPYGVFLDLSRKLFGIQSKTI